MSISGKGRAPATCGELLQGQFSSEQDFLVTFPIDWWSQAEIIFTKELMTIQIEPARKTKSLQAAKLLLNILGIDDIGGIIKISSTIPEGKGLGSSTADITAVCRALGDALNINISPEMISSIARQIEPSDGSMYPNVVCYNHRKCELIETLGKMPPCCVLIIDNGGEVNTQDFNKIPKKYNAVDHQHFSNLYQNLKTGINCKDLDEIGMAAKQSAILNQRCLFKPNLEKIISISEQVNAAGLCAAHSGTILGLMFYPEQHSEIRQTIEMIHSIYEPTIKIYQVNSL